MIEEDNMTNGISADGSKTPLQPIGESYATPVGEEPIAPEDVETNVSTATEGKSLPSEAVSEEYVVDEPEDIPTYGSDDADFAAPKKEGSKLWIAVAAIGIVFLLLAPGVLFMVAPGMKQAPEDLDSVTIYTGSVENFDMATLTYVTTNITAEDEYKASGVKDGNIDIDFKETVTDIDTDAAVPELETSDYTFTVDRKTFEYKDDDHSGHWIFPIEVEKKDYPFWNSDLKTTGTCEYLKTEKHEGVETYKFQMTEDDVEMDLAVVFAGDPVSLATLQAMGAAMTYDVVITFWISPETGTIIDLEKDQQRYLTFPDLRYIPDDLDIVSVNKGNISLLNMDTASYDTFNATFTAVVKAINTTQGGLVVVINENLTVQDTDNDVTLAEYGHDITYCVNRKTGAYVYEAGVSTVNLTGMWLFPIDQTEQQNYTWFEDSLGVDYDATFVAQEVHLGIPTYKFTADYMETPYNFEQSGYDLVGQEVTSMTMWVEPETGSIVDRQVEANTLVTFPDLRYLPEKIEDDDITTPEGIIEGTLAVLNQNTFQLETMDITTYVYYETVGLDATGLILKINETMVVMNGTTELTDYSSTAAYGVNRKTAEYVDVTGFSNVTRTGQWTFPVGVVDNYLSMTPVASFDFWNDDIQQECPVTYQGVDSVTGVPAFLYKMEVANVSMPLAMLLGSDLIPDAMATYNATYTYWVEPATGIVMDMVRDVKWKLLTPSPSDMWFGSDSQTTYWGTLNGMDIYVEKNITQKMNLIAYGTLGIAENWENTTIYDNATKATVLSQTFANNAMYVAGAHNMTHATFMDGMLDNFTFSPNAVTDQRIWNSDIFSSSLASYIGYVPPSAATNGFNISLYQIYYDNATVQVFSPTNSTRYDANIIFQVDQVSGMVLSVDKDISFYHYNSTQFQEYPYQSLHIWSTPESVEASFMTATVLQIALAEEAYGAAAHPSLVEQAVAYSDMMVLGAVAKATDLSTAVVLSEQTIPGGIVKYQTDGTTAAAGAMESYLTGMSLAFFSSQTVPVLDQHMEYSDSHIKTTKKNAADTESSIKLIETYVPLTLAVVGIGLIAISVLVMKPKGGKPGAPADEFVMDKPDPIMPEEEFGE